MISDEFATLQKRVEALELQGKKTLESLQTNTTLTLEAVKIAKETRDSTFAIVDFTTKATGAVDLLNGIVKFLKPFGWVGIIVGTTYAAFGYVKAYIVTVIQHGIK